MFSQDRDLMVYEPGLLRDVAWVGQRRLSATGSVSGTTLTLASGSFADAQVQAGQVVLFDGVALEIVSVESATTATVSLLRADAGGGAVPPIAASNRSVMVYDFSPQRAIVHRQVLAMLGIDSVGEGSDGVNGINGINGIDESMVTNPGALTRLECLGTLHLVYSGASAPGRGSDRFEQRVGLYLERYRRERESVVAMIDMDGDGIAEATRRANGFVLSRR